MAIVGGTWTYSGNPAASSLDQVRFLIGDTDTNDQLISDEEILWSLGANGSIYAAAMQCCSAIIGSGRLTDKKVGDLEIFASQRVGQYQMLMADLKRNLAIGAVPYAGGISVGDKQAVANNSDRVEPFSRVGMHDNPSNRTTTASTST